MGKKPAAGKKGRPKEDPRDRKNIELCKVSRNQKDAIQKYMIEHDIKQSLNEWARTVVLQAADLLPRPDPGPRSFAGDPILVYYSQKTKTYLDLIVQALDRQELGGIPGLLKEAWELAEREFQSRARVRLRGRGEEVPPELTRLRERIERSEE